MMTSGVLARQLGISQTTLRNYETRGLIKPHWSAGGWRLFREQDAARLQKLLRDNQKGTTCRLAHEKARSR